MKQFSLKELYYIYRLVRAKWQWEASKAGFSFGEFGARPSSSSLLFYFLF